MICTPQEGTTYSLVPYVDAENTGSVSGIVSAGGTTGAVMFGLIFRQFNYHQAFTFMGALVMGSSLLSMLINFGGHAKIKQLSESETTPIQEEPIDEVACVNRIVVRRSALSANVRFFRSVCPKSFFLAVVKANAYGHGMKEIVQELSGQVDWFGVVSLDEAKTVRRYDFSTPILIMGHNALELWNLSGTAPSIPGGTTFVVSSVSAIQRLQEISPGTPFHLKVDTGMSRHGVLADSEELDCLLKFLEVHKDLPWTGLMTHFADADNVTDNTFTMTQLEKFERVRVKAMRSAGPSRPLIVHAAATAASLVLPEARYDMIRVGLGMYGMWPSKQVQESVESTLPLTPTSAGSSSGLTPVLSCMSRLAHSKWVSAGASIGYGCTYTAEKDTLVGVVPFGYYNGYDRGLSNKACVLLNGVRCRVLGCVSMNTIVVDMTGVEASPGDDVVLIGKSGAEEVSANELAGLAETINYEIVSRLSEAIPRIIVDSVQ
jgi:alanine racemase